MNRRLFLASLFGSVAARAMPLPTLYGDNRASFGWYYFASASNQSDYLGYIPDFDALPETYRESLGFNDLRNAKLIPLTRRDFRIPMELKKVD